MIHLSPVCKVYCPVFEFLFKHMFIFWGTQCKRPPPPLLGLTPEFHAIFNSSAKRGRLRVIDCGSFENSQAKIYNGVYFNKAANLSVQCTDCNSTINRLYHKFFSQNVPKTSCLNKNILKKKVYGVPAL